MAKILIGLVAAIAVAVAGFFGFEFYMQHRVVGDVEAAFDQIRATGGKASHGKVSFDLWSRTVAIADIASKSTAQPPLSVKIAGFTASGVSQPDPTRFSADTIEASGVEVGATMADQAGWHLTYKVPRITIKDYSGPGSLQRQPASSSAIDMYRFALEHLASVTASSVTAPSAAATVNFGAPTMDAGDLVYSGLTLNDIKNGNIASMKVDRVVFNADTQQTGKAVKLTGELANVALYDFDANAAAAVLDPQKVNDDRTYRVYRQMTAGPYAVTVGQDRRFSIDGITIDDIGVRPSRLRFPALMAAVQPPGTVPTPVQVREMFEKLAGIYEGTRVGKAELRGFSVETPEGPFKLSAFRLNLENGKIGEFAFEGLDARIPKGPFKVGRFALKSFDIANVMRMLAQFSDPAQKPPPERLAGLLPMLEGVEVKDFVAPYGDRQVNIDTFSLNWGQFVGPIPSKAQLTAKMSGPVDATDPKQTLLVAAGIDTLAFNIDLGAAWTEASRTFALDLGTAEIGGLLKASAQVALANVPREVFSVNPVQAATMAAQIEAGTMEIMLRDIGGVDLAVAHYARIQNIRPDEARRAIVDNIRATGATVMASRPDAALVMEALVRFIENPKGTLTLKLTPRAKAPAMQLVQALKTDPSIALAQFRIEASTGR